MKKLLSIALLALPALVACTNKTVVEPAPGDPVATAAPDPATPGDPPPEADACACPATCQSTAAPGKLVCHPAVAPATLPGQQQIGKFVITGFEYWQWKKKDPYADGKAPAWGYNGDGEPDYGVKPTDASRACMAEARKVLEEILTKDPPAELEALRQKTVDLKAKAADPSTVYVVNAFWQWNNDMTDAPASVTVPDDYEGLWLYDKRLIKWMSHTERDGSCRLPTRESLVKFAKGCMRTYPTCYESRY